jgi:DnaJ-like protein
LLIIVLVAGLIWAVLAEWRKPRPGTNGTRRRSSAGAYWLLGAVLLGLVFFRFGANWLVVAVGAVLALARSVLPLLRLLPFLQGLRSGSRASNSDAEPGAHGAGAQTPRGRPPPMTRDEALQILGLDSSANHEDVQREYRRLMKKLHPDLGGSSYLAAKINQARDALL